MSFDVDPGYDTPELREVLESFRTIDFDLISNDPNAEWGETLFTQGYDLTPLVQGGSNYSYLPLGFTEGSQPQAVMTIYLAIVNPNSKHKSEAIDYLEYLSANMTPEFNTAVHMNANEPIENSDYIETLAGYERAIEEYDTAISQANDEEARNQLVVEKRAFVEWWNFSEVQNNVRWEISAESIAAYRALVEDIDVRAPFSINSADFGKVVDIRDRFYEGALTVDQFIKEMDRMFYMSILEDQ
jgi:ABC-type glycerol-3-phosphate transport system substrate-binding protein